MSWEPLKYLSDAGLSRLRENVVDNLPSYLDGDFSELSENSEWSLVLSDASIDPSEFCRLDPSGTPEAEIENSRIVWGALKGLNPSLACQEGIWARITHVEGLEYTRSRWLKKDSDQQTLLKSINKHFFAKGLNGRRDDNAIARLWWNAYIANQMLPGTGLEALPAILRKADIRLSFIERSLTASRPKLAAGVVRAINKYDWLSAKEENFRKFMKELNQKGGGVMFEVIDEVEVDIFMLNCAQSAGMENQEFSGV
ncbi:DUF6339 family protein [Thalassospira xiamenensis]|uniref:DUF6339 family protein n=1 Tax=Thalassospira xiamenensis TaxID=220697 RepID=UPI0007A4DBC0|nr:DUF6339 family protein [Thalassospira xiamenensis]KZB54992.1 hypothetical protein AUP41_18240 [Thalassospira xiamenensis]